MKRYHDGLKIELIMGITPLHFRIKLFWSGRYSVLLGVLGFCICAQSTDVIAQDMNCIGTLGEIETGQIRVPRGRTCILRGTIVRGNVTVEQNATLRTYDARVYGRIIPNRPKLIHIDPKTVVGRLATGIFPFTPSLHS